MKGRPPGTPKSDDPGKKKRKRQSRGRDLCDVKIKITEYFAGAAVDAADLGGGADSSLTSSSSSSAAVREALATGVTTRRLWTIQRVNGNGTNGVGDGKLAAHKHDLERSDEIKKNSVQRWVAAKEKGVKKVRKPSEWKSTGNAAVTARKHAKESDLKLYASCFWYVPFLFFSSAQNRNFRKAFANATLLAPFPRGYGSHWRQRVSHTSTARQIRSGNRSLRTSSRRIPEDLSPLSVRVSGLVAKARSSSNT